MQSGYSQFKSRAETGIPREHKYLPREEIDAKAISLWTKRVGNIFVNILECIRKLTAEPEVLPTISKMLIFVLWLKMVDLGHGSAGKDKKP
jgi:hypothetical protein